MGKLRGNGATAGGATVGDRTDQPSVASSGAAVGDGPRRPEGQSPPPKRRRAEPGPEPKPQGPDFRIPRSRWRYRRPKTMPPKDSVGGQKPPEQPRPAPSPRPSAPTGPKQRAPAGPEQRAPADHASSPPRKERTAAGEVVVIRAVPVRSPSGSPSASAERARRGPSPQPSSGQAPEPLPEVLGSAQEVIWRLEAAVAAERSELGQERAALVDERDRLEEARKLLKTRIASARTVYEKSMREVAEEREALEEAHDEAVVAQEKAGRLERLMAERDQGSRRRATELLAHERQVVSQEEATSKREEAVRSTQANLSCQNDKLEGGHADILRREEQVVARETDVDITSLALDARKQQIARREVDADLASSALTTREELVAKRDADLATQEQAVKARDEQLERAQTDADTQCWEVLFARGILIGAVDGTSLEARLKNAKDELEIVLSERTNVKLMM
ncbi:uncharacterized protein LOC133927748 [Phragmites australis]|uniref:uncharacterized protein LOC133927748 n=1 Tax=Phragmites australis TaxID=29695 RepID=UPI002D78E126|nr:uncharacterized protein LOC133927748 [Phragmites australis]